MLLLDWPHYKPICLSLTSSAEPPLPQGHLISVFSSLLCITVTHMWPRSMPSPPLHPPSTTLSVTVSAFSSISPLIVSACRPEDSSGSQLIYTRRLTLSTCTLISCMLGLLEEMPVGCWHSRQPHWPPPHSVIIALSHTQTHCLCPLESHH